MEAENREADTMQISVEWTQDPGPRTQDPGPRTQNPGPGPNTQHQDREPRTQDSDHMIQDALVGPIRGRGLWMFLKDTLPGLWEEF